MSTSTTFAIGQRVGIVTGVQSVSGPHVYTYGTVVRTVAPWGEVEYVVQADDGSELVYRAYLLRSVEPVTTLAVRYNDVLPGDILLGSHPDFLVDRVLRLSTGEVVLRGLDSRGPCQRFAQPADLASVVRSVNVPEPGPVDDDLAEVIESSVYAAVERLVDAHRLAVPDDVARDIAFEVVNRLSRFGVRPEQATAYLD